MKSAYTKKSILIRRVRCSQTGCRSTHAIIPSFSVPSCLIGTKELNEFILARANGETVSNADQCFIDAGMSPDYVETIHKRLKKNKAKIKTIFPEAQYNLCYAHLIVSLTNSTDPVEVVNLHCIERGFNPVLFSRRNILIFDKKNRKKIFHIIHPPGIRLKLLLS